jgi:cytochrome c biogenesis protein CcmG, thiol:disulfide interchange protein DsbE
VVAAAVGGVVVLGVIALLVVGLVNRDSVGTSIQDALAAGERPEAPALTLPVLVAADGIGPEGAEVSLADLRGRTVVLNFWASWCTPCEIEAPVLEAVAARYRDDGDVVVLGVDVQDLREKALEFVRETGVTYPTLRDGGDDAMNAYQVPALPETFVIDPEGRVALKIRGIIQEEAQLTTAIDQVRRGAA